MHRFESDFFGGLVRLLLQLTSSLEAAGIAPAQGGITPIH